MTVKEAHPRHVFGVLEKLMSLFKIWQISFAQTI
jgi:hypothetical protein